MAGYLVLSYDNLDELTEEVNRKWAEGWRPLGTVVILPGEVGLIFLQAMVREEADDGKAGPADPLEPEGPT